MKTPGRQRPEFQFRHANKGSQAPHDSLLELAVRLEAPDWKKAVETYRAVLARPGTSAYSREIALFSIGRLLSDNDAAAVEVRFAFNAYLKNFPHGTFTGESYLRLADLEYKTDPGRALVWYEKISEGIAADPEHCCRRVQSRPYSAAAEQARPGNGIADKRPESR